MEKTYLISVNINPSILQTLKKGDKIIFDMPPFCSGEYAAIIDEDENGLFINKEDDFFAGCRDGYRFKRPLGDGYSMLF